MLFFPVKGKSLTPVQAKGVVKIVRTTIFFGNDSTKIEFKLHCFRVDKCNSKQSDNYTCTHYKCGTSNEYLNYYLLLEFPRHKNFVLYINLYLYFTNVFVLHNKSHKNHD